MATVTMTQAALETETRSDLADRPSDSSYGYGKKSLGTMTLTESTERMPPLASLLLLHYFLVLGTVNVVITIPTANEYAERLGAGHLFAGLMIGALPLLGIAGNLFCQKLLTCMPFKHIWIVCSLFNVLGSVLYALAGLMRFKWTLLIARGLMGFFSAFSLPGIYVSHTVGVKRRSEILYYFSAVLTLGCAVGPALAAMLEGSMKFIKIENLVLDSDTIPGWFMATLFLFFTGKLVVFLQDLPKAALEDTGRTLQSPRSLAKLSGSKVLAACACCWQLMVSSAVTTGVEVYTINVSRTYLHWSIASSAWFVAGLMLVSGLFNLSMGKVMRIFAFSDVTALLSAELIACFSCILLFNFDLELVSMKVSILAFGLVLVLVTAGLTRAVALSICSKLFPPERVNGMMTWATIFMGLGRGGGSIVSAVLDPDSFAPVLLTLFLVTFIFSLATRKYMKPDAKAN